MKLSSELQAYLTELFRDSHSVYELSSQLFNQSKKIQEISMNAAIAADHASQQTKVFSEIARQIGLISSTMRDSILRMREYTGVLTNNMLSCLVNSEQKEKFIQATHLSPDLLTSPCVNRVIKNLTSEILETLLKSDQDLKLLKTENHTLYQMNERVWTIVMNLKISSSRVSEEEELFFLSIAQSLELMSFETGSLLEKLSKILNQLHQSIITPFEETKETQNAA